MRKWVLFFVILNALLLVMPELGVCAKAKRPKACRSRTKNSSHKPSKSRFQPSQISSIVTVPGKFTDVLARVKAKPQGYEREGGFQVPTSATVFLVPQDMSETPIYLQTAYLDEQGRGFISISPDVVPSGSYYAGVQHTGHLGVISGSPVDINPEQQIPELDFTNLDFIYTPQEKTPALNPDGELWAGDADGNKVVDPDYDLSIWRDANGSQPGDPNWDERPNFNGDNVVNASKDFPLLRQNLGKWSYIPSCFYYSSFEKGWDGWTYGYDSWGNCIVLRTYNRQPYDGLWHVGIEPRGSGVGAWFIKQIQQREILWELDEFWYFDTVIIQVTIECRIRAPMGDPWPIVYLGIQPPSSSADFTPVDIPPGETGWVNVTHTLTTIIHPHDIIFPLYAAIGAYTTLGYGQEVEIDAVLIKMRIFN